MTYKPEPLDTNDIVLPEGIADLAERLAKNAHDHWARLRISEGWTHGIQLSEEEMTHPCLVPYHKLSEADKEIDRATSIQSLKSILLFGYELRPIEARKGPVLSELEDKVVQARESDNELRDLLALWESRDGNSHPWRHTVGVYQKLGERFLDLGAASLAKEVAQAALELTVERNKKQVQPWNHDKRLRLILSMALIRTSSNRQAITILESLLKGLGPDDDDEMHNEVTGNLARVYKDLAFAESDLEKRNDHFSKSLELYQSAFDRSQDHWVGINVATLANLTGDVTKAKETADQVQSRCSGLLGKLPAELKMRGRDAFWLYATIGESHLNLGELNEAEAAYRRATECSPRAHGQIVSARRQARLLLQNGSANINLVNEWLSLPQVVVFSGHMPDAPGRKEERFPYDRMDDVKEQLLEWARTVGNVIGYASAAAGADLLFLETLQELGQETCVILPCVSDSFETESVRVMGDERDDEWSQRYQAVLSASTRTITAARQRIEIGGISYEYANEVLFGLAKIRARELETDCRGLVVWDGGVGGRGGTGSSVALWQDGGIRIESVNIDRLCKGESDCIEQIEDQVERLPKVGPRIDGAEKRGILFGDAVNFSCLAETQIVLFVKHFLGPIAELVREKYGNKKIAHTHLGDGFFFVFDSVTTAGNCALDIRDFVQRNIDEGRWEELGLPAALNIRIGLHAGPVYRVEDPFRPDAAEPSFAGSHIIRAARLEPRTPIGEVYASDAFAALYELSEDTTFLCEYAKRVEYPKRYGTFPAYVLRRL